MEFSDLVKYRQSDRRYSNKPVEKEKLLKCLESARLAPSAYNSQPWKFVIADDAELKEQIADCAASLGMNGFTHQSPVLIAVVLEKSKMMASIGSVLKDKEYSLMDIGMAVSQFCLQATEIGLGTCIIGWFDEKRVKKLLHIDSNKRVPLLISVGYSESPLHEKVRKPIEKISSWNKY
jgi:nitroreductase